MADPFPWHLGVFDAHCHPTDTMTSLQDIPAMKAKVLTIMATRAQDQELVRQAADEMGITEADRHITASDWRVVPCFGWHPWFSHQMFDAEEYDGCLSLSSEQKVKHYQSVLTPKPEDVNFLRALPDPRPISHFLSQTRQYLLDYPLALIGEVGLDKSFRIPDAWLPDQKAERDDALTPGGREGRRLSPYRVSMDHQKKILLAQLILAGEQNRAVSVHGVQAHGILFDLLMSTWRGYEKRPVSKRERKREAVAQRANASVQADDGDDTPEDHSSKPYPPRICLHSFSGPAETVRQYTDPTIPAEIYFSFSTAINFSNATSKTPDAVKAVAGDRLLIESDLHTAGDRMDEMLEDVVRKICELKGWYLAQGIETLGRNWKRFIFGSER